MRDIANITKTAASMYEAARSEHGLCHGQRLLAFWVWSFWLEGLQGPCKDLTLAPRTEEVLSKLELLM